MQYQKVKSASKVVIPRGDKLSRVVQNTLRLAADVVGSTLGPGGSAVLIERAEHNLPPIVTKDGVTVFRSLGREDATEQVILEAARDAAVRTAGEAGDGTTTATVMSEAIVRLSSEFTKKHPKMSPQRIVRHLEGVFSSDIEPWLAAKAVKSNDVEDRSLLWSVAKTSANGDEALADKVIECYDLVGDDGNVTIIEMAGPSGYEVEHVDGYPISSGYEESAGKFYQKFVNDPANQRVWLTDPVFLLYHGKISDIQSLVPILTLVGELWKTKDFRYNVVLMATGFSETVLWNLAANFVDPNTINVFPCIPPVTIDPNGQLACLEDIAARTGATVLDPMSKPLPKATVNDLGYGDGLMAFEATRFRSTMIGMVNKQESAVLKRAGHLRTQIEQAASEYDKQLLQERLGKLTGGIARLKVVGPSNGETKEKRDRAEDAVCAVRGAIQHGCLAGGGYSLLSLADKLESERPDDLVVKEILSPALRAPVKRLLENCGLSTDEAGQVIDTMMKDGVVYDAAEGKFSEPFSNGVVDSVPAVREAIRNSLSIASLLGTLGGTVVFGRDRELERAEARETMQFLRDAESDNPANDRP